MHVTSFSAESPYVNKHNVISELTTYLKLGVHWLYNLLVLLVFCLVRLTFFAVFQKYFCRWGDNEF